MSIKHFSYATSSLQMKNYDGTLVNLHYADKDGNMYGPIGATSCCGSSEVFMYGGHFPSPYKLIKIIKDSNCSCFLIHAWQYDLNMKFVDQINQAMEGVFSVSAQFPEKHQTLIILNIPDNKKFMKWRDDENS